VTEEASVAQTWDQVAAERGALADDLAGLSRQEWETRSLCPRWSVHDVVAHLSATASMTPPAFFLRFARAGFNFDRFADAAIADNRKASPEQSLSRFRSLVTSRKSPPGPKTSWLGETVVHAEDIRRPLGIGHQYDMDALRQVADFYKGSNALIGAKNRIAGLTLIANDTSWTHGTGERVEGPMLSLLMAMTGRSAGCDDLSGPGTHTLRSRCT
jgi:uncharacterized protein (TIGR03083 family)